MFISSRKLTSTVLAAVLASLVFVGFGVQSSLWSLNSEVDRLGSKLAETSNVPATIPTSELVARKLIDGEDMLDEYDPITRESVYLFEKSLYRWLGFGAAFDCNSQGSSFNEISRQLIARSSSSKCFGMLYAVNIASFVPVYVSTALSGLAQWTNTRLNQTSKADDIYRSRAGICGEHTTLALALFARSGYTARPLEFYYTVEGTPRSHIIPEVLIGGVWYPVDTTYGGFWRDEMTKDFVLANTDDVLTNGKQPESFNNAIVDVRSDAKEVFYYITNSPQTLRGGTGVISLSIDSASGGTDFKHIPNFIGDNIEDGKNGGVVFKIRNLSKGEKRITVDVQAQAITGSAPSQLCLGSDCIEVDSTINTYEFVLTDSAELKLVSEADVSYFVLRSISWKPQ